MEVKNRDDRIGVSTYRSNTDKMANPAVQMAFSPGASQAVLLSYRIQETFSPIIGLAAEMAKFHEAITPSIISAYKNIDLIQKAISPGLVDAISQINRFSQTISPAIASIAVQLEGINTLVSPSLTSFLSEYSKMLETITPSIAKLLTSAIRFENSFLSSELVSSINHIKGLVTDIDIEDISFNNDGTISLSDQSFRVTDVKCIIENCLEEKVNVQSPASLAMTINSLLDNAAKQHPLLAKIMIFIILPILINIFTSQLLLDRSYDFEKLISQNKTTLVKSIRNEVQRAGLHQSILRNYKFVSTSALNVHVKNAIKSKVLCQLYFGQVVQVVYKNKNWTLIRCINEEGEITVEGWVFTRYLSKFK